MIIGMLITVADLVHLSFTELEVVGHVITVVAIAGIPSVYVSIHQLHYNYCS